ncbi:hypothetical protein QKC54_gp0501 [Megavirus baoshan]|uniref:Uncharacterized protein n=1 Tax=Megavirus baoshan TaxID=2496520 RepID=A0A3S5HL99_9VIRU|nr:hypothetical protein QKC54_gp0501 [Megavirus baoshan]AZL89328.1 hypothetical protein Mb0571 [Megavirus baoshan]
MNTQNPILNTIIVVYGYNNNYFPWRTCIDNTVYKACGLIVDYYGEKYIITTRQYLISCENLVGYSYDQESCQVTRHILTKISHCIESNIMILKILDYQDNDNLLGYDLNCYTLPKKNKIYQIVMPQINTIDKREFEINIYEAKYLKSCIFDINFVPRNFLYKFQLPKNDLTNLSGSIIYKSKKIIGLTIATMSKSLFVVPIKIIKKIISDYVYSQKHQTQLCGLVCLPFDYEITKNNVLVSKQIKVSTSNGNKIIKSQDIIKTINYRKIQIIDHEAVIYDNDLEEYIPIDIYCRWNHHINNDFIVELLRNNKIIIINTNKYKTTRDLALTSQWDINFDTIIPYYEFNGLILTWLTHELIDTLIINNITPENHIIQKLLQGECIDLDKILIIIDCIDNQLVNKYKLPVLKNNSKDNYILSCPVVLEINNNNIQNLQDLNDLDHYKITESKIKIAFSANNHKYIFV